MTPTIKSRARELPLAFNFQLKFGIKSSSVQLISAKTFMHHFKSSLLILYPSTQMEKKHKPKPTKPSAAPHDTGLTWSKESISCICAFPNVRHHCSVASSQISVISGSSQHRSIHFAGVIHVLNATPVPKHPCITQKGTSVMRALLVLFQALYLLGV